MILINDDMGKQARDMVRDLLTVLGNLRLTEVAGAVKRLKEQRQFYYDLSRDRLEQIARLQNQLDVAMARLEQIKGVATQAQEELDG